ncbi:MAG: hypothetical protein RXR20_00950 [Paraburkholderia sp.]|jgi:hypothetical protein|uniref:hypothetical protein n=1 Tax=Burkholderiaceae TaxID=119060 RepID=UPI0010F7D636|nr:hypothetical protein [Burkholderia sp. 4M9327F10]
MKRTVTTLAFACAVAARVLSAHAASTDPFDFDYEIDGGIVERPALIFNDGSKTYIQPRAGQIITADGGHPEGPYVVIDGTPELILYTVGGHTASARWSRANSFIGKVGAAVQKDDQPASFDGFTNRLVLIGGHGALEPVRALSATMPVGNLVRALVPQGWSGSAQKDVDLTNAVAFQTRDGENWLGELDRLMTQTGLYADVDFSERHVRLHRDAPKSAALNYSAGQQQPVQGMADPENGASAPVASAPVSQQPSMLARKFGAEAIRDGDDTHTQIRFTSRPQAQLTVTTLEGKSLHPKWDGSIVTIDRVDHFVVSDGTTHVEVARVAGMVYEFDVANPAHLEAVFEKDGQTYFKFAPSVVRVTVADVRHLGTGQQKGRYYRFDGIADQFIVTADGATVNVTRRRDVKYFERTGAAS